MAAKRSSADAVPAEDLGLVAHTDLPKLDSGMENSGQIFYKIAEINPSVCRESG